MKEFLDRNPGLRSRVPFRICFSDYSVEEMLQIAKKEAGDRGFTVADDAAEKILALCETARKIPAPATAASAATSSNTRL